MSGVAIFLDCYGVLVSASATREHWRLRFSDWARLRWGGERSDWLRAYDISFGEYLRGTAALQALDSGYSKGFLRREADQVSRVLALTGKGAGENPLKLVPEMVMHITEGIDAQYAEVRNTIRRLSDAGHPLYVVTNSSDVQLEGILSGTDLEDAFDFRFTGDTTDAGKSSIRYWEKVIEMSGKDPNGSVVVDNKPRCLVHPASLGFTTVHLSREVVGTDYVEGFTPDHTITSLFELLEIVGSR